MTIAPIGRLVENTTLAKALYALRNSRIHLMRNLGDAVEVWSKVADEPAYQGQQASRNYVLSPTELHLLFPEAFVERLLRAGMQSLGDFLVAKGVDPYNSLRDTSAWELRDFAPLKSWSTPQLYRSTVTDQSWSPSPAVTTDCADALSARPSSRRRLASLSRAADEELLRRGALDTHDVDPPTPLAVEHRSGSSRSHHRPGERRGTPARAAPA